MRLSAVEQLPWLLAQIIGGAKDEVEALRAAAKRTAAFVQTLSGTNPDKQEVQDEQGK